jgi:hypothetical protein
MNPYLSFILLVDDGIHPRFDENGEPKVYTSTDGALVYGMRDRGEAVIVDVYKDPGGPTLMSPGGSGNGSFYP